MKTLKNKALITIFFFLGGSFFFPIATQAGTCVCYFGTLFGTNDCAAYESQTDDACDQLCHDKYGNGHRTYDHSDDDSDPDLLVECQEAATAAANAQAEEAQADSNSLKNVAA